MRWNPHTTTQARSTHWTGAGRRDTRGGGERQGTAAWAITRSSTQSAATAGDAPGSLTAVVAGRAISSSSDFARGGGGDDTPVSTPSSAATAGDAPGSPTAVAAARAITSSSGPARGGGGDDTQVSTPSSAATAGGGQSIAATDHGIRTTSI